MIPLKNCVHLLPCLQRSYFNMICSLLSPVFTFNCRTLTVRDVVVHNLLFAESSNTLLDIIGMGVDIVEGALANQVK